MHILAGISQDNIARIQGLLVPHDELYGLYMLDALAASMGYPDRRSFLYAQEDNVEDFKARLAQL